MNKQDLISSIADRFVTKHLLETQNAITDTITAQQKAMQ
jgi:hypothetical protein